MHDKISIYMMHVPFFLDYKNKVQKIQMLAFIPRPHIQKAMQLFLMTAVHPGQGSI